MHELEVLTYTYWQLSRIRTGRSKDKITTAKAIATINYLESNLGPVRPLLRCVKILSDAIVVGKPKRTSKPATISILPISMYMSESAQLVEALTVGVL